MSSRENVPNRESRFVEDSSNNRYCDRGQRGYFRGTNNYARRDTRNNGSIFLSHGNSNSDRNFNHQYNRLYRGHNDANYEENSLSWRRTRNLDQLINQRESLVTQIYKRQYECMICFIIIDSESAIWSCDKCFHIFHINCIKTWSKTCGNENENTSWPCPACKKEYAIFDRNLIYQCYCGKVKNPSFNRSIIPHSCGEVCGKSSTTSSRCPHVCSLLCHPGPCPVCEASLKSNCHCGKTEFIVKCTVSENNLSCGNICGKLLNCAAHTCQKVCHFHDCSPCTEMIVQRCCCQQEVREVLCGSVKSEDAFYTCYGECNKIKDCGQHHCQVRCHAGPCDSCQRLPKNTTFCPCGKTPLSKLSDSKSEFGDRKSCLDPVAVCDLVCDKSYTFCDHKCPSVCHEDACPPCMLTSNVKCRCKKTSQNLKCTEIARIMLSEESVKCSTRCKAKKLCGIHRCPDTCCDVQVHLCALVCGKLLSCKQHACQRPCHQGNCLKCDSVSFDELFCECGAQKKLPPIDCGAERPLCSLPCSRAHLCDHEVTHTCHNEPHCPHCTVLTSKKCPGDHKILYNIPCFRPVVTCGLSCGKPLPNCSHLCNRICHEGHCTDATFVCTQLCTRPRSDCGHPCHQQCHQDDCEVNAKSCQSVIELRCVCGLRLINNTCEKLDKLNIMLKSDTSSSKREVSDFCLSDKDNSILLLCDNECKKVARSKQLADAFETDLFSFDHVAYSSFLRDFAVKNPDFLVQIDSTLCGLIRKLDTDKLKKVVHRFDSMNREKRRFIMEISDLFALSSTSMDPDSKSSIMVEAVKGICKIPANRLLHFIQRNYPQVFKTDKPTSLKNVKSLSPSSHDFSYAERMKSINQINKP